MRLQSILFQMLLDPTELVQTQSLLDTLIFDMFVVGLSLDSISFETSNISAKPLGSLVFLSFTRLNVQKDPRSSICNLSQNQSSREQKQKAPMKDIQIEERTMHGHRSRTRADRWNNCNTRKKKFLLCLLFQSSIK